MKNYINKVKGLIFLHFLFYFLYTVGMAAVPYLSKLLFDYSFNGNFQGILWLFGAYLLVIILSQAGQYLAQMFSWKLQRNFYLCLRSDLIRRLFRHIVPDFRQKTIG